jgi:hypothetical protein
MRNAFRLLRLPLPGNGRFRSAGLAAFALAGLLGVFLGGCVLPPEEQDPDLPWNEPAGWENNGFAIPM